MSVGKNLKHLINLCRFNFAKLKYDFTHESESLEQFDLHSLKSTVIAKLDGKLGDTQNISLFIDALHKHCPDIQLTVLCSASLAKLYKDIFKTQVIVLPKRPKLNLLKKELCKHGLHNNCDLLISTEAECRPRDLVIASTLKPKYFAGMDSRLKCININLQARNQDRHFSEYFMDLLKLGKISEQDYRMIPMFSEQDLEKASALFKDKQVIGIVPFGASRRRRLSRHTFFEICDFIEKNTDFLICPFIIASDTQARSEYLPTINQTRAVFIDNMNIYELAAYTSRLQGLISVDTANIHLANAAGVPVFGIYPNDKVNFKRWANSPLANSKSRSFIKEGVDISSLKFSDIKEELAEFTASL